MSSLQSNYNQVTNVASKSMVLFDNINSDQVSSPYNPGGGKAMIIIRADSYVGVTVDIQIASEKDPTRWNTMTNGSFTSDDNVVIEELPVGCLLRASGTGLTGANNLFVEVLQ